MNKIDLIIPMFALYNFKNIKDIVLTSNDAEYLKDFYDLKHLKDIYNALIWAKENPNFYFKGIMKDAPVSHRLKFSNRDVYKYLIDFKIFMENEKNELLADDRQTKKPQDLL